MSPRQNHGLEVREFGHSEHSEDVSRRDESMKSGPISAQDGGNRVHMAKSHIEWQHAALKSWL